MTPPKSIVILVRQEEGLTEALRAGRTLQGAGASVSLFFLCHWDSDLSAETPAGIDQPGRNQVCCYTNDPSAARHFGLPCMTIGDMAEHIQNADLVVPF